MAAKTAGFSLRASLVDVQGVTCETALRMHMDIVHKSLQQQPLLDIRRYRVNPSNPNNLAPLAG